MFGLFEKVVSTAVSVATLPVAPAIDLYNTITEEDKPSVTGKVVENIVDNLSDIATGDWDNKRQ